MQSPTTLSFTFTVFFTSKNLFFVLLLLLLHVFIMVSGQAQGGFSESEPFFSFIRAIDPQDVLHINGSLSSSARTSHPCMMKLKGVRCDSEGTNIVEIMLESLNLTGTIDTESLCMLKKLKVLSLAENNIRGNVPNSIPHCGSLCYLNLSSNHLNGRIPIGLMKPKFLRKLDLSNNNFPGKLNLSHFFADSLNEEAVMQSIMDPSVTSNISQSNNDEGDNFLILYVLVIGIMLLFLGFYFASIKVGEKSADHDNDDDDKTLKSIEQFDHAIRKAKIIEVKEEEDMMTTKLKKRDHIHTDD